MISQTPLGQAGRRNRPDRAAFLLASDSGGHITGQTIVVDGGVTII